MVRKKKIEYTNVSLTPTDQGVILPGPGPCYGKLLAPGLSLSSHMCNCSACKYHSNSFFGNMCDYSHPCLPAVFVLPVWCWTGSNDEPPRVQGSETMFSLPYNPVQSQQQCSPSSWYADEVCQGWSSCVLCNHSSYDCPSLCYTTCFLEMNHLCDLHFILPMRPHCESVCHPWDRRTPPHSPRLVLTS